ncbi:MAG TPA: hypothetical protein VHL57_08460, partial [Flavobacteriales bacterium]|nr:hypothetical protein [Flavobacteriales bacterium]
TRWHEDAAFEQASFPIVEDNVHHDTLVTQVTIDLKDGTYVMVASSVEETFEGLRLYRYRLDANGAAEMLAVSSPAYDSWTMLPTFFQAAEEPGTFIVLANFGEKQSWGQKVLLLNKDGFSDLGFLEVALPQHVQETDTAYVKLLNAAPITRITSANDTTVFEFAGDSLYLFDDVRGRHDYVIAAPRVRYELSGKDLQLVIDGKPVPVPKTPA